MSIFKDKKNKYTGDGGGYQPTKSLKNPKPPKGGTGESSRDRKIKIRPGMAVIYTDDSFYSHLALVTKICDGQCVNLVYVSNNKLARDSYGKPIRRASDVDYVSMVDGKKRCWSTVEECLLINLNKE